MVTTESNATLDHGVFMRSGQFIARVLVPGNTLPVEVILHGVRDIEDALAALAAFEFPSEVLPSCAV